MKLNKKRDRARANSYSIPQKDFSTVGLRDQKDNFRPSVAATPFFGSNVKDIMSVNDIADKYDLDTDRNYDFARKEKVISRQELINRYGTEYPEFQTITADTRRNIYGNDITVDNKKKTAEVKEEIKEKKVEFDFVKTADEVVGSEKKNAAELDNFNFDQFKTEDSKKEA